MMSACWSFGSLSKIAFDISSGSSMNQYDLPVLLIVRCLDTSCSRNEIRLVAEVVTTSTAPVCIAA